MSSTYVDPYQWTSRNQYSDKSVHRTGEIRAFQELYGYYPPPDAPLPSIEPDDDDDANEFVPGSKSCPISLDDDDESDIKIEDDDLPLAVTCKYYVSGGVARKAPVAVTAVTEAPKKTISSPPRYHPSLSGKFLASGPPPPRHLRPSADGKPVKPKVSKPKTSKPNSSTSSAAGNKRPYLESDDEDDFIPESSFSRNKRARIEDSDDENDADFVDDKFFIPAPQPKKAKKVKKVTKPRNTTKKNTTKKNSNKKNTPKKASKPRAVPKKSRATPSGKQPIKTAKHPSEYIRPALRYLPPCPGIQNIISKKGAKWVQYEHDALYFLIVQQRNKEVTGDINIKPLMDTNLFGVMVQQLQFFNIFRTELAARNYWNRYGRVKSGWDERIDTWENRDLVTCSQENKAIYRD